MQATRGDFQRESEMMADLRHPNIVCLHNVYHDELHTYIILDYLQGGELLLAHQEEKCFTEPEASAIMRKLVSRA